MNHRIIANRKRQKSFRAEFGLYHHVLNSCCPSKASRSE